MFDRTKNLFLISILAVSLTSCSGGSQTGGDASTTGTSTPAATPVSTSEQNANSPTTTTIPGVKNISEVQFKSPSGQTQAGFFDTVNNATATKHNIAKTASIKMGGWAVLPDKNKPADSVIITLADNKTVVAVVPVNFPRPDVAKALKNPAYQNVGWAASVNASALPAGKSVLKAWAYNADTKLATGLTRTHEIVVE